MDALQRLRKSRGFSQQQIADELGISRQTYSNYELGKREANYDTLRKLADYFHVSVDTLLGTDSAGQKAPENAIPIAQVPMIPVYGRIAAGAPILADENVENYFPIPAEFMPTSQTFMLNVKGESMINAGILDGDQILVQQQSTAENGDIIVALIDDSATVKTFYKEDGYYRLQPENDTMEPIIVKDDLKILGKVIGVFRFFH